MVRHFFTFYLSLVVYAKWSNSQQTPSEDDEVMRPADSENLDEQFLHSNFNGTEDGEIIDESSAESNLTYYNSMLNETWLNLVSVMDLFTQREYDNSSAIQALTAAFRYTHRQQKNLKNPPIFLKKPFIVIEGLDIEKRNALAARLAQHVEGAIITNPLDTYEVILKHMPNNSTILTNGYYILNTYIVALHARYAVQSTSAIVPGYWLGRAATMIASNFIDKPPPYKSKFWEWPRDLVKPDVIFYITDRHLMKEYEDRKFVQRFLHVFDNWADPKCVPLVNCESLDAMMEEMDPYVQELLANRLME